MTPLPFVMLCMMFIVIVRARLVSQVLIRATRNPGPFKARARLLSGLQRLNSGGYNVKQQFSLKVIGMIVCMAALLTGPAWADAMLAFDVGNTGTISYAGGAAALTGTSISIPT